MTLAADIKLQIRAAADEELPPGYPREEIGLLPGDGDDYIITSGGMKGMRGFFTRDDSGAIVGIDAGGRMYRRVPTASGQSPGIRSCTGQDLTHRGRVLRQCPRTTRLPSRTSSAWPRSTGQASAELADVAARPW